MMKCYRLYKKLYPNLQNDTEVKDWLLHSEEHLYAYF